MLKIVLSLITLFASMQFAHAKSYISGTIEAVEIAVNDEFGRKSLCITYLRSEEKNKTYGVVEDMRDCFYARKFHSVIGSQQRIPSGFLFNIYEELNLYLMMFKNDVHYLFSEVE